MLCVFMEAMGGKRICYLYKFLKNTNMSLNKPGREFTPAYSSPSEYTVHLFKLFLKNLAYICLFCHLNVTNSNDSNNNSTLWALHD